MKHKNLPTQISLPMQQSDETLPNLAINIWQSEYGLFLFWEIIIKQQPVLSFTCALAQIPPSYFITGRRPIYFVKTSLNKEQATTERKKLTILFSFVSTYDSTNSRIAGVSFFAACTFDIRVAIYA